MSTGLQGPSQQLPGGYEAINSFQGLCCNAAVTVNFIQSIEVIAWGQEIFFIFLINWEHQMKRRGEDLEGGKCVVELFTPVCLNGEGVTRKPL